MLVQEKFNVVFRFVGGEKGEEVGGVFIVRFFYCILGVRGVVVVESRWVRCLME